MLEITDHICQDTNGNDARAYWSMLLEEHIMFWTFLMTYILAYMNTISSAVQKQTDLLADTSI